MMGNLLIVLTIQPPQSADLGWMGDWGIKGALWQLPFLGCFNHLRRRTPYKDTEKIVKIYFMLVFGQNGGLIFSSIKRLVGNTLATRSSLNVFSYKPQSPDVINFLILKTKTQYLINKPCVSLGIGIYFYYYEKNL